MSLQRRSFLFTASSCAAAAAFAHESATEQVSSVPHEAVGRSHIFFDESGLFGNPKTPFVVGAVRVDNLAATAHDMASARTATGYNSPLLFSSTDKYRMPYAQKILSDTLSDASISFAAVYLSSEDNAAAAKFGAMKRRIVVGNTYASLVAALGLRDTNAHAFLRQRSFSGDDEPLREDVRECLVEAKFESVRWISIESSDVCQFADLLTGCVYRGLVTGIKHPATDNKLHTKDRLVEYVAKELGANTFESIKETNFSVTRKKITAERNL